MNQKTSRPGFVGAATVGVLMTQDGLAASTRRRKAVEQTLARMDQLTTNKPDIVV